MCHQPYTTNSGANVRIVRTTHESVTVAGPSMQKRTVESPDGWDGLKNRMTEYKALNRIKSQQEKQVMAGLKSNLKRDCDNIKNSLHGIKTTVTNLETNMDHMNTQTEALIDNLMNTIEED